MNRTMYLLMEEFIEIDRDRRLLSKFRKREGEERTVRTDRKIWETRKEKLHFTEKEKEIGRIFSPSLEFLD